MSATEIRIHDDDFFVNGLPVCPGADWEGHRAEGLLLNSRMVQATFDDLNPATRHLWDGPEGAWDPDRNTDACVRAMADWRAAGLNCITVNLQGGSPFGYSKDQPWHYSAFGEDGSLDPHYMQRLDRVLAEADTLGMAVIVGLFYFGQLHRCRSDGAVRRAVAGAIGWLAERGYRNILLELGNEVDIVRDPWGYGDSLVSSHRTPELMEFVRNRIAACFTDGWILPVSTSLKGGSVPSDALLDVLDFVLLHGNGVSDPLRIAEMVRRTRSSPAYRRQPILFNEDDHYGFDAPLCNMTAAISEHAGWGFFDYRRSHEDWREGFQSVPVDWSIGSERKRAFFSLVARITGNPAPP